LQAPDRAAAFDQQAPVATGRSGRRPMAPTGRL